MRYLLSVLGFVLIGFGCAKKSDYAIQTCKVKKGVFNVEIVETGEVNAVLATNISSPSLSWQYGPLKILKIVDDGKEILKGDTIIIFDPSEVKKTIFTANSDLEIARAELQKMLAEQELKIEELEADLKSAKIAYEISKLELELSSYESEIKKKEIQLNLDRAKLDLNKASQVIDNQKKIDAEDINQSRLKIRQSEANLYNAKNTLQTLTVVSPADGIAILRKNWSTGNKWQVGDQTWSGNILIELPDLKQMKIVADINEVEISKIKLRQASTIKLDAFSDSVFTGKIISVASLAKAKENMSKKIKVFPVEILVDGSSKVLMPGMTVSVTIIANKINGVLYVPIEAVFKKDGKDFVYVKHGHNYIKKEVKTGLSNNDYIIVTKDLKEGEVLALTDPFENKKESKKKI